MPNDLPKNIKNKEEAINYLNSRINHFLDKGKLGRARVLLQLLDQVKEGKFKGQYKYLNCVGLDYTMPPLECNVHFYWT